MLQQAADDFAEELRKEFRVQLIKIPKKVCGSQLCTSCSLCPPATNH